MVAPNIQPIAPPQDGGFSFALGLALEVDTFLDSVTGFKPWNEATARELFDRARLLSDTPDISPVIREIGDELADSIESWAFSNHKTAIE